MSPLRLVTRLGWFTRDLLARKAQKAAEADPAMAYRFGACNDGCCKAYVCCMTCSETDATTREAKRYGEKPLHLSDLEGGIEDVCCEVCGHLIYGLKLSGGFV
jgi:hypothetical protein